MIRPPRRVSHRGALLQPAPTRHEGDGWTLADTLLLLWLDIPLAILVARFWGWVLGLLGAILAIPLTLLVKAVWRTPTPRQAGRSRCSAPPGPCDTNRTRS